jgi:hypothetical protein
MPWQEHSCHHIAVCLLSCNTTSLSFPFLSLSNGMEHELAFESFEEVATGHPAATSAI